MRNQGFTRIVCLALALLFLVSGAVVSVGADGYDNTTDKSIVDYEEKLNTISYDEYVSRYGQNAVVMEIAAADRWTFTDMIGNVISQNGTEWTAVHYTDGAIAHSTLEASRMGIDEAELNAVNGYMAYHALRVGKEGVTATYDLAGNWTYTTSDRNTIAYTNGTWIFSRIYTEPETLEDGTVEMVEKSATYRTVADAENAGVGTWVRTATDFMSLYSAYFPSFGKTLTFDATSDWVFVDEKGNTIRINGTDWTLTEKNGTIYTSVDEAEAGRRKDSAYGEKYSRYSDLVFLYECDGRSALYTPSEGSVTWTLDLAAMGLKQPDLFSIHMEYYPVYIEGVSKSASIEREFYINGEVPFSEARSLTFSKIWSHYSSSSKESQAITTIFTPQKDEDIDAIETEARAAGFVCVRQGDSLVLTRPTVITSAVSAFVEKYGTRFFTVDADRNELRPLMRQDPAWTTYTFRDSDGFHSNDFGFVLAPDKNGQINLTLDGVNEPMAISAIILTPYVEHTPYSEYRAKAEALVGTKQGTDSVKIEAEYTVHTSTNVVYPVEDRTSALTSPNDTTRTMLNTIGTEKWETAGQWVEYRFIVNDSGWYDVFARFKQRYLDGMYVCRQMELYTDYNSPDAYAAATGKSVAGYYDGVPFAEATELRYDYDTDWQITPLSNGYDSNGDGVVDNYQLYLEGGVTYTIRLMVTLGSMSQLVQKVEDVLNALNTDYLNIIKLTGTSPDDYRDYSFNRLLPDTLLDMMAQANVLEEVSTFLKESAGVASTYSGICDKLVSLLRRMARDEDEIAKNLSNFKSYVGSLGTFLTDAKTQPVQIDYLLIQSPEHHELPEAEAGFFASMWHEIQSFIQSFFRDYNSMGSMETAEGTKTLNVWVPYGRDQANVIRNLSSNDFTANSVENYGENIAVDLKLVTGSTLLPSILAGMGPDVYLGLGQASVINYAIRGALNNLEEMEGFNETVKNFNDAAMLVLGTYDSDGDLHYYGLPENQDFPMMFVRTDILAGLQIEIPKTWDEIYVAQSKLESNNMEIGVTTSYKIHLYQLNGELFADDGMRINLDSVLGLQAFETMCNMFTQYSFPYKYDSANRFRTGEMPIIIADYTNLYNKLKVFATEIEGSWTFVPVPGYEHTDSEGNAYVNNQTVASVLATVMISSTKDPEASWDFIKWYTGAGCQIDYANDMVAIIGDSAKHPTANREALKSMPWTRAEYEEVSKQFENLASVPNYPGYYIIDRYTEFAFLSAYNDDADPSTELLSYINTINKEITRKREEFELETLEIGQTLADKRTNQVMTAMDLLLAKNETKYAHLVTQTKYAIANEKLIQILDASNGFMDVLTAEWKANGSPEKEITKANGKVLKVPTYFVSVTKQTAESKRGGYDIEDLSEEQLVYFVAECLKHIEKALASY